MCSGGSAKKAQKKSGELAQEQFQWQKDQANQAREDADRRRAAMEQGLTKIGKKFSGFNDKYYEGIGDQYRAFANPQIAESQASSEFGLRSALANKGKLGSSTEAKQNADLTQTYAGIYRDTELKAQDYVGQQRSTVNAAKQNSIQQMYASESADAGLQAASGAVQSISKGPSYEPISSLLLTAAKYANLDYNNSIYGGKSNGLFSPLFASQTAQPTNSATSGSDVKNVN